MSGRGPCRSPDRRQWQTGRPATDRSSARAASPAVAGIGLGGSGCATAVSPDAVLPLNAPGNDFAAASAAAPLSPAAADLAAPNAPNTAPAMAPLPPPVNAPNTAPPTAPNKLLAVDAAPVTFGTRLVALAVTDCVILLASLRILAVPVPASGVAAVTFASAAPAAIFASLPVPTVVVAVVGGGVVAATTGVSALAVLVGLAPAAALPPLFTALSPVVSPKAAVDAPPPLMITSAVMMSPAPKGSP